MIRQQASLTLIFKSADIRIILSAKDREQDKQEGDWQQTFGVIEACLSLWSRGSVFVCILQGVHLC